MRMKGRGRRGACEIVGSKSCALRCAGAAGGVRVWSRSAGSGTLPSASVPGRGREGARQAGRLAGRLAGKGGEGGREEVRERGREGEEGCESERARAIERRAERGRGREMEREGEGGRGRERERAPAASWGCAATSRAANGRGRGAASHRAPPSLPPTGGREFHILQEVHCPCLQA